MPTGDSLPNVRRVNRALERAWQSGLLPRPDLSAVALEASALRDRPPSSWGRNEGWREALLVLSQSLFDEAKLNPLGQVMAHGQIVMALRARLRAAELWRRRPEILERRLAPPILILGHMRSGTTRMQRLLACDPRLAQTRTFESLLPVPQPARRLRTSAGLAFLRWLNPQIARVHPTTADQAEEQFGLFSFSLGSAQFEAQWRVPSFSRWWESSATGELYSEFRALLRTIAWSRGDPGRRWVLKAPQFHQDLPTVLDAFPGAALICLQRDLAQILPSSASLVWNQMRIQSDDADPRWIGAEWLRKTRLRQKRAEQALSERTALQRLVVDYSAMNQDWRQQIRRIYDFLGMTLSRELVRRMEHYLTGAKAHHGHRYSLEQFGLSASLLEGFDEPGNMRAVVPPAA